ncbi:MAG: EamA family transporter [Desulfobacterales bacterium]|jgi:drug/metabolite transporter (DMT)-like permease|nr:EamA family transporter [Desulfobacterales bacterium]
MPLPLPSSRRAIALLLLTALLWSTGGLFVKLLSWHPFAIFSARATIASIVFLIWLRRAPLRITPVLAAGALGYMGAQFFFILATRLTTAANAIFLQYTAPIYVLILGVWILRERPQRIDWITLVVILAGLLLCFGQELTGEGLYGNLAAVSSGVALAVMIVSSRAQKESHPAQIFLIGSLIGAVIGLPAVLQESWSMADLAILAYLGVIQTALAAALYSIAIRQVPALTSTLILMLEPVLNPLWVFLVIGETPAPLALAGGAVVLGAIGVRAAAGDRKRSTNRC